MFYSKKWKSATALAARPSRILRRFKFSVHFDRDARELRNYFGNSESIRSMDRINFIFDEISKRRDALIVSMLICQCCDVILWNFKRKKKKKYIPHSLFVPTLLKFLSTRPPCPNFFQKVSRKKNPFSLENEYFYYCNTPHSPEKKKRKKNS